MSDEAPIAPSTPPPPASRDVASRAIALPPPADAAPPTASAEGDAAAATYAPAAFPFSLQFDPDTHRLMIESRDPVTGFIVFQVPPKTAIRAIEASGGAIARGERVDREAGAAHTPLSRFQPTRRFLPSGKESPADFAARARSARCGVAITAVFPASERLGTKLPHGTAIAAPASDRKAVCIHPRKDLVNV